MADPVKAHFYGGHADGAVKEFPLVPRRYDFPTKSGDRHPEARAFTRYTPSDAWSAHFGRLTLIPAGFPGMPPKPELQAA